MLEGLSSLLPMQHWPDSLLAQNLRSGRDSYFYDRDGDMFRHVLNYMRSGKLLLPSSFDQLDLLQEEAHYFNLYTLHDDVIELQERERKKKELSLPPVVKGGSAGAEPPPAEQRGPEPDLDTAYECIILCADEDGKVERWFSAPVDLRFESNGCLLGDCRPVTGYSHILDYRDYTARPGNTVPDHFNIAAIVARLLGAGYHLAASSSAMDQWHREFYYVFIRSANRN